MPLANPAAEVRAESIKGLTGLGLHFAADRVITKDAVNLIVFHHDLLNVIEDVPFVIGHP